VSGAEEATGKGTMERSTCRILTHELILKGSVDVGSLFRPHAVEHRRHDGLKVVLLIFVPGPCDLAEQAMAEGVLVRRGPLVHHVVWELDVAEERLEEHLHRVNVTLLVHG